MRLHELIDQDYTMKNDSNIEHNMAKFFHQNSNSYKVIDGLVNTAVFCKLYVSTDKLDNLPVKFGKTGDFNCSKAGLTTLQGAPSEVCGDFNCSENKLSNFIGGPAIVHNDVVAINNPLKSLEGLPKEIRGGLLMLSYTENLPLLRILLIPNLKELRLWNLITDKHDPIIENIIVKYLGKGRTGAIQCAAELSKAGFKGNARL